MEKNNNSDIWKGRIDGADLPYLRLHQIVKHESPVNNNDFVLFGFCVDEGVRRNNGRIGAQHAPNIIRKNMSNFPVHGMTSQLHDFGNLYCENQNLEHAQNLFSNAIAEKLNLGARSIGIGGGHEITYAHFKGIRKAFPDKKIGIINIDAHFDNREIIPNIGCTSGTGFWQISQEEKLNSLHIGIQKNSNTSYLFNTAEELGMNYILSDDLYPENIIHNSEKIDAFIDTVDLVYLTVCMDVFNASISPGVSALAYNGIFADYNFMKLYRRILNNKKLISLDVAEVNPKYDIDERTSRLAASLIYEWLVI